MFFVKSKAILQMTSLNVRNCNSFKTVIVNSFKLKNFFKKKCFIPKGGKFETASFIV